MPDEDIAKLRREYLDSRSRMQALMKNPQVNAGLFNNKFDFRDKHIHFANSGGTRTSRVDKLENYYAVGYPYKRGVKLVVNKIEEIPNTKMHYEPHVEAGGGVDLYSICVDIDEFTHTATVVPITNNYEAYLVFVKGQDGGDVKAGTKLFFNEKGELQKITGENKQVVNAIALSAPYEIATLGDAKLYLIHATIFGNRAVKVV
ncbi:hypothetical protein CR532_05215 (plasmid) [Candidatus Borreliella tachyglossi]|uniref:Uncharacterized protein n=1 Tax=Candidatus Borreliella tachyglossi TaxID=1964448 RepID=A0A2S1LYL8_9SPIR|nr:DUF228 domain-containing protein [Candidatus Borreliella tachyglossi]AWG43360.1 hypothetical protein CR532_05015 [Candidatus Borreliella tachyglossi]AWG43397.1 hypothetical protein CR532_05215 [Candidatus Borreliella tachyglossi]